MPTTGPIRRLHLKRGKAHSRNSPGTPTIPPRFCNGSLATAWATRSMLSRTGFVGSDPQITRNLTNTSRLERRPDKAEPDCSTLGAAASSYVPHHEPAINVVQVLTIEFHVSGQGSVHSINASREPLRRELRICVLVARDRLR
jgi:hypothetical protein